MIGVVLGIKTDAPEAEVFIANGEEILVSIKWQAHRELSDTILKTIESALAKAEITFKDLEGIVVYKGPGSFTGLRIGITVANTLAYGLQIPIVSTNGDSWVKESLESIAAGENGKIIIPHYGAEPNITKPRK